LRYVGEDEKQKGKPAQGSNGLDNKYKQLAVGSSEIEISELDGFLKLTGGLVAGTYIGCLAVQ